MSCNLALNAVINQKEDPHAIYVHGSVMVYTEETLVTISKADPQGINPKILLLNLTVKFVDGPMKGTQRPFFYEEHGAHVDNYDKVQVVSNSGDDCSVDVEILG
ncbi:MAG: hypothetical protein P1V97_39690 [Planctomycetota bacterium]|nr:hypothetical protein [Planctomycetota bacterium]